MKTQMKPNDYDVYEIFEELKGIKNEANKVEWLATNFKGHKPLIMLLWMNYSADVKSSLPEGAPPYNKEEQDGPSRSNLWQYLQVLPIFTVTPQSQKMKMMQKERMFIEMLDSLANKEADLVVACKDRRLEELYDVNLVLFEKAFKLGIRPIRVQTPPTPKSKEDIATDFLNQAADKKEQARVLTNEAKELEKQAKVLLKEAKDESAAG